MIISTSKHPGEAMIHIAKRLSSLLSLSYVGRNNKSFYGLIKFSFRHGGQHLFILKKSRDKNTTYNFILDIAELDYNKQVWSWLKSINIGVNSD